MTRKGLAPVLCNAGSNATRHHYFGCPVCGSEVGGFAITEDGENGWSTHEDKFCRNVDKESTGVMWSGQPYIVTDERLFGGDEIT